MTCGNGAYTLERLFDAPGGDSPVSYAGLDDHIERAIAEHVLEHRLDAALDLLRRHLDGSLAMRIVS